MMAPASYACRTRRAAWVHGSLRHILGTHMIVEREPGLAAHGDTSGTALVARSGRTCSIVAMGGKNPPTAHASSSQILYTDASVGFINPTSRFGSGVRGCLRAASGARPRPLPRRSPRNRRVVILQPVIHASRLNSAVHLHIAATLCFLALIHGTSPCAQNRLQHTAATARALSNAKARLSLAARSTSPLSYPYRRESFGQYARSTRRLRSHGRAVRKARDIPLLHSVCLGPRRMNMRPRRAQQRSPCTRDIGAPRVGAAVPP
jgi:hypothetical protein